jgi:hypothetical protein
VHGHPQSQRAAKGIANPMRTFDVQGVKQRFYLLYPSRHELKLKGIGDLCVAKSGQIWR